MTNQQLPVHKVHATAPFYVCDFSVARFKFCCEEFLVTNIGIDYWEEIIKEASIGKAVLTAAQRPHLAIWIKENKFYLTENMSPRMKVEFNRRILELENI